MQTTHVRVANVVETLDKKHDRIVLLVSEVGNPGIQHSTIFLLNLGCVKLFRYKLLGLLCTIT